MNMNKNGKSRSLYACGIASAILVGIAAQVIADDDGADITAVAFGDFYDMSDGARPIAHGGSYRDIVSGDTWYSTWAGDGTAYLNQNDGLGFDNLDGIYARCRLCRLDGDPNGSTDGFRGVNLNPGILGNTMPHYEATPEWRIGYSSTIYEQDGALYIFRFNWSPQKELWPPIDASMAKSPDGGKTWINHLGQVNAPLPDKEHAIFHSLPWSFPVFIQYGKGGAFPNADNADKYVYLTTANHLARILRDKLAGMNQKDIQFYRGAGLDGMLNSSWSNEMTDGGPMACENIPGGDKKKAGEEFGLSNIVYNFALRQYVRTGASAYSAVGVNASFGAVKSRFVISTARHPWGPWRQVLSYGIWGRAGWNLLLCNKFTTEDGKKMHQGFSGEYLGDVWNYGFQYTPVYLSTGPVDIYEAEEAKLDGLSSATDYPCYSGTGYVTGFTKPGDKTIFAINKVNGSGWHIVRIRYTSPKANERTLSIYVNGKKTRRVKLSLNSNDCQPQENWTDRSDIYRLKHGANTFEIRQDDGDAAEGVMIDYIAVSREPTHDEGENIAPIAMASSSSGEAANAIKGCVDGLRQWVAKGAKEEWIRLDWPAPVSNASKIVLYDQAGTRDQVLSGTLSFSDGSTVKVGRLQNDGQAGTVVTFLSKTIRWVKFTVDSVRPGTQNAGLGEIQVYASPEISK